VRQDPNVVQLESWRGPWDDDDPDANFKADIALYSLVDPMSTIRQLSSALNVPDGALVHYILAKWSSEGSGGLMEIGPTMVEKFWGVICEAQDCGTDEARLEAYSTLNSMISWLRVPLLDSDGGTQ
jgi:hypothetical protein